MTSDARADIPRTLSLKPATFSKVPSVEALIRDGLSLLEASRRWERDKSFHGFETFFHSEKATAGTRWCSIVLRLPKKDASFEDVWSRLGMNKFNNEKRFKPYIKEVTQMKYVSELQSVWSMYCAFAPPLSPRVFTVYHAIHLNDHLLHRREGVIVSIPVDLRTSSDVSSEIEEKGVKGRYVRVEQIRELDDGEVIEWRLATCEDLGGFVPRLCAARHLRRRMIKDAQRFLAWLRETRNQKPKRSSEQQPTVFEFTNSAEASRIAVQNEG